MEQEPRVGRRAVLALGAASALSACATTSGQRSLRLPTSTASTLTGLPGSALPAFEAWRPHAGEEEVAAKFAAVRRIEQIGNTRGRRLHVIDAQYGGLLSTSASVLVVCQSWQTVSASTTPDGHTYDVRVSRVGGGWQVTAIHPSSPGPPISTLSSSARRVLTSSRISLPPAARADIESGQVHDTVCDAMTTLATRWSIAVSVIRSGHPLYVFGTSRLSDHPRGRAFDTWAIDQTPVVSAGSPAKVVPAYMEALAALGSYNVGGPVLLGAAPQFFSDQTHHDHVHAGFRA